MRNRCSFDPCAPRSLFSVTLESCFEVGSDVKGLSQESQVLPGLSCRLLPEFLVLKQHDGNIDLLMVTFFCSRSWSEALLK
jgi:hypothetical protein